MDVWIENKTYTEIKIGNSASVQHTLVMKDILLFALMSGDVNPAHLDEAYAKSDMFHHIVAHGMWGASLISTVLGTLLPGPGTIYVSQSLQFLKPITLGDRITACVVVKDKSPAKRHVRFDCLCTNQWGKEVIGGVAEVIAPTEKVRRKKVNLPQIETLLDHLSKKKGTS